MVVAIDIETIVPNPPPGDAFPKWPMHRTLIASLLTARSLADGRYDFQLDNLLCATGDEARFYREVDRRLPRHGTAVTANGRGFDFPALALGAMAHRGLPASDGFVLLTARCSFELVQKAIVAGCPLLVTISAASTLARRSRIEAESSITRPSETGTSSRLKLLISCSILFSKALNDLPAMLPIGVPFLSVTLV